MVGDWGIIARHCVRMVRFLSVRPAGGHHQCPILLRRQRHHRLHFRLGGFRRRLRGAAVRRAGLRTAGRSGGAQVHFLDHHEHHGRRHFFGRSAAELRDRRRCRAGHAGGIALASGAGAGRGIRRWGNLKIVIICLLGAVMGQAVVWYTGQFYALFFLERMLRVDGATTNILTAIALVLATPGFIFFGWLSDKIGRKPIILAGCLLALLTYFPLFEALTRYANPALYAAQASSPVTVIADPAQCSFQFDPIGKNKFDSTSCDIAKSFLAKAGVSYRRVDAPAGTVAQIRSGTSTLTAPDPKVVTGAERKAAIAAFQKETKAALSAAGYPDKAHPAAINKPMVVLILFILVLYVTMVYGPIAALLVELFPTRIRYSAMSLPYHIGNGWFGGFLPTIAFAMVAATGDIYYGLWYPIVVAAITLALGLLFLPETKDRDIHHGA